MCGRYVLVRVYIDGGYHSMRVWVASDDYKEKDWFKQKIDQVRARYDIRPTQDIVMMHVDPKSRRLQMPRTKWGWRVPWKDEPIVNAREDALTEKRIWSKALRERRCVIPATAFYEWQRRQDAPRPVPWEIKKTGADMFYFAGLWKPAVDEKTGEACVEATIITQMGNELLREVHNHGRNAGRQPVFLDDDKIDSWLDPAMQSPEDALSLLRQIEDGEWEGRMLSEIGNDSKHTPPVPLVADMFGNMPEERPKRIKKSN